MSTGWKADVRACLRIPEGDARRFLYAFVPIKFHFLSGGISRRSFFQSSSESPFDIADPEEHPRTLALFEHVANIGGRLAGESQQLVAVAVEFRCQGQDD
jgi:hypothetical protein